jgi:hypothetical protein
MQRAFNKIDPTWGYATVALFFACIIWVSPMLSLRDNDILGRIITVTSIVMLTLCHRVAGIIALIVVIAIMQNRPAMEGFTLPKTISNPVVGSASSDDFFSWKTPDEFKQKYCIKGLNDDGWNYILNPKLFTGPIDASGNPDLDKDGVAVLARIDNATLKKENGCPKFVGAGINVLCDPKCNWKMAKQKEGFTPNIENSPILNAKNLIKDNVKKAKTMTESFFSR